MGEGKGENLGKMGKAWEGGEELITFQARGEYVGPFECPQTATGGNGISGW